MIRIRYGIAITLMLLLPIFIFSLGEEKPLVTVLDFSLSGISEAEGLLLTDFIANSVRETGRYRLIDRGQRDTILKEQKFSLSGCTDEACQIEVGRLLSAHLMFVGSIGRIGDRFILNMKLIDVATGEAVGTASEKYIDLNTLVDDSSRLVTGMLATDEKPSRNLSGGSDSVAAQVIPKVSGPADSEFILFYPGGPFQMEYYTFRGEKYPFRFLQGYAPLIKNILTGTPAIDENFQSRLQDYLTFVRWNRSWQIIGTSLGVLGFITLFAGVQGDEDTAIGIGLLGGLGGVALNLLGGLRMNRPPEEIVNHYNLHYAGR
ncbi:MAG: hypothetical protein JW760_00425 [Spirochaetales bacterium]|nr:hypothetical protein [Spirochaetales bacterium]